MSGQGDFDLDVRGGDEAAVVRVRGDLDLSTSPELEAALEALGHERKLVVDLAECEFIDSSALRVLFSAASRAEEAGGSVVLVAPGENIRRVLEIANAAEKISIHSTLDAAS